MFLLCMNAAGHVHARRPSMTMLQNDLCKMTYNPHTVYNNAISKIHTSLSAICCSVRPHLLRKASTCAA